MKLTTLIMTLFLAQVSASTFAQKLTYKRQGATLRQVFSQIRIQTGYHVLYSEQKLDLLKKIDVDFRNANLDEVLNQVLGDELEYSIDNKDIFIIRKPISLLDRVAATFEVIDVRGRVTDKEGRSLAGANVYAVGQNRGAITDMNGRFYLPGVNEKSILEISYIGYLTKKVKARGNLGDIELEFIESKLEEVQVIGYGTEQKRFSIGSIATVTAEQIGKQPVTNPLLALQGQVPGLSIIAANGVPGSTTLVQIHGQNSLATDRLNFKPYDQPYFIVDGVPFASGNANISQLANLAMGQSFSGGLDQSTGIGAFNGINPSDIESITILKDADATAIYGTKGANGVILITTKKGKAGKTTVEFNLNSQVNQVARPIQFLNTQQYLQLRREAFAADGFTPNADPNDYSGGYAPDLTIYEANKYTNWQKIIQGNSTKNTDLHATVSGGSDNSTYIVSGGYTRSNYNYPGDYADQRYSLHSALTSSSVNKKLNLTFINDFSYDQNSSAGFGGSSFVTLPPNAPDQIDGNGNLIWSYNGVPIYSNLYASLKRPTTLQAYNFNTSLNINYEIIPGLAVGGNAGYNRNTGTEHSVNPSTAQAPSIYYPPSISAAFANTANQALNIEPQINYKKDFANGMLTALLGGTYQKLTNYAYQTQANGYSNDAFLGSINGATSTIPFDTQSLIKYVAFFGRLTYIYDQKYILEVSGRRDGSSNFGPGKQFGSFGSIGGGWIFSEENGFKNALPFISFGKLTGNYGTTGSDASKAYQFQALYGPFPYSNSTPFQGIRQNVPLNLYNPDFKWATKRSLSVAMDLGFFNDRLSFKTTYYRDRQSDQLVAYPLATQAGFASVFENQNATVQNKGWEFTFTSANIRGEDFNWMTSFNLTFNRNKLLEFPNLESSSYALQYVIGQPTSVVFGYPYKGVNPTTGEFEYYAADGSATSNPNYKPVSQGGDQIVIGNREIKFMGGFGNTFSYKNLSLYVFCQFSSSTQPNAISSLYNSPPGYAANLPVFVLGKYWTGPGDTNATLQRLASSYNSEHINAAYKFSQSTGAYTNDTYLRIKTAALSYAFPENWTKKFNVNNASVFCNVQNLFTITNYKFGDPEQPGNFLSFPLQRIVAFGLKFKF